ncbi:hypothetical protein BD413DRAFT_211632 [Trametes elegans]|nr:hypothetical protein BD413DRAFT_211632 [Trametes elegans]
MAQFERLLSQYFVPRDRGAGRTLEQLLETDDLLSGPESQRLRTYFTSNHMNPQRDLDEYGRAVLLGNIDALRTMYAENLAELQRTCSNETAARLSASEAIDRKRWGPTRVPIFNLILLCSLIKPGSKEKHYEIARWLIDEVKVPVDGTDLSGSTALHHAISTKPSFEPAYAQMLFDAGANVNHRNRYGGTPAHEAVMVWDPTNRAVVRKAGDAFKWFLDHGGNVEIKDSDGKSVRQMVQTSRAMARAGFRLDTWRILEDEDRRRNRLVGRVCAFCGQTPRGNATLRKCSACQSAVYCAPAPCQRGDWAHHKLHCRRAPA